MKENELEFAVQCTLADQQKDKLLKEVCMAQKTILILLGSPRRKGNSTVLAEQIETGALSENASIKKFFLQDMQIQPCNACDACQDNPEQGCTIEDDMQQIYPFLKTCDVIIVATPVYWFSMSAQTKLCIDRWYALESASGSALTGKTFAFALSYGDTDPYTSGAINAIRSFQDMCRYLNAPIAGIVYGTAMQVGEIEEQKDIMEKAYQLGKKLGRV